MGTTLEYILKLKDQLSPGIKMAGTTADAMGAKIKKDFDAVTNSSKFMNNSIGELKNKLKEVNNIRFGTVLSEEFKKASREAKALETQINSLTRQGSRTGTGSGGGFGIPVWVKSLVGAGALYGVGKSAVSADMQNIGSKRIIDFATGGHGSEIMSHERALTNKLGLDYKSTLDGMQRVTASMRGSGLGLNKQVGIFDAFQEAGAALNLTPDKMHGILYDVGEMVSSGVVNAKEMRRQMAVYLPGALRIAADAMGVTQEKFNKMMKSGEIMATDFLPKFAKQLHKEFGEAAADAATSAQAGLNRFNNSIYESKVWLGEKLLPALTQVWNATSNWISVAKSAPQALLEEQGSIGSLVNTITMLNQGNGTRSMLLHQLVKEYPNLFGNIDIEKVKNEELLKTLNNINAAYGTRIKIANSDDIIKGAQSSYEENRRNYLKSLQMVDLAGRTDPAGVAAWNDKSNWLDKWMGKETAVNDYKRSGAFAKTGMEQAQSVMDKENARKKGLEMFQSVEDAYQLANSPASLSSRFGKNTKAQAEFLKLAKQISPIAGGYNTNGGGSAYIDKLRASMNPITANAGGAGGEDDGLDPIGKAGRINGGGARNITITIGKQVETINLHALNVKEGMAEIEEIVKDTFLRVVKSANGVAVNNQQ
jgi:tape measure domain-containing protein